jgi:hypothetical protein
MRTRSRRNTENRRIKSELIIYRCNLSCELEFDDELAVQPSRHCVLDLLAPAIQLAWRDAIKNSALEVTPANKPSMVLFFSRYKSEEKKLLNAV